MDDRRRFITHLAGLPPSSVVFRDALWAQAAAQDSPRITKDMLVHAAAVAGESLTDSELDAMLGRVNQNLPIYTDLHAVTLDNGVAHRCTSSPCFPAWRIGTETLGSIVEPSGVCGVTGLRPTFGRVSRHGVMA